VELDPKNRMRQILVGGGARNRLGDDPGSPEIDPDRTDYPRLIRIDPGIDLSFDS
jgi:hypothetical protein